jgi:hypothetical protein
MKIIHDMKDFITTLGTDYGENDIVYATGVLEFQIFMNANAFHHSLR